MKLGWYKLDGHQPVEVTLAEWARWAASGDWYRLREVGVDTVGDLKVSTVFLCCPHGPQGQHLFETMVFGPQGRADIVSRYATWDEAEAGHITLVAKLEAEDG